MIVVSQTARERIENETPEGMLMATDEHSKRGCVCHASKSPGE